MRLSLRLPLGEVFEMNVHFKSVKNTWETPQGLFDALDAEFHFTLDPCASSENAKCKTYFTAADDGLLRSWKGHRVFMNPPYGRDIGNWVVKAARVLHCSNSRIHPVLVVGLLPARTDTRWFHDYIYNKAEIRFLKGRIRFVGAKHSAPFPSMVVIWRP